MADQVQYVMDRMAPVMVELQRLNLFTQQEVKQIIKFRRDHEYILRRRQLTLQDYLQYLEYEINLEALRRTRMKRLQIANAGKAEGHGIRHVSYIFERAVRRFPKDIKLWEAYLDFLQKHNSKSIFSSVLMRAIHLHPRQEQLWIKAATMESVTNNNAHAARVLMQRALRINAHAKDLWLFYFKQEIFEVLRVRKRRQVLGLSLHEDDKQQEDNEDNNNDEEEDNAEGLRSLLRGDIPMIVFKHAVNAIPNDLDFSLQLYSIIFTARQELPEVYQTIEQQIKEQFSTVPQMYLQLAQLKLQQQQSMANTSEQTQRKRKRMDAPQSADASAAVSESDVDAAMELLQEGVSEIDTLQYKADAADIIVQYLKQHMNMDDAELMNRLGSFVSELLSTIDISSTALTDANSVEMIQLAGLKYQAMLLFECNEPTAKKKRAHAASKDALTAVTWLVEWITAAWEWFNHRTFNDIQAHNTSLALAYLADTALCALESLNVVQLINGNAEDIDAMKIATSNVILSLWRSSCSDVDNSELILHAMNYVDAAQASELCRDIVTHVVTTAVTGEIGSFWCTEYLRKSLTAGGIPAMLEAHEYLMKNTFAMASAQTDDSGLLDYFLTVIETLMHQPDDISTGQQQYYNYIRNMFEHALQICQGADRNELYDRYARFEVTAGHPEKANDIKWRASKARV